MFAELRLIVSATLDPSWLYLLNRQSNQQVISQSRSVRGGVDLQRKAIAEARKRHIFDGVAHLKNSPVGQAFFGK